MTKRSSSTKFDGCFRFKNEAVKIEFQAEVKADPMCSKLLDERATKLGIFVNWRESLDFLTPHFVYTDGKINWRNTSGISGEYPECLGKKPRYSMGDVLTLMLACTATSAWNDTESVLALKVLSTFHTMYKHFFGVDSTRTKSSFAGQGQLLIKFKKENKLDDDIWALQEENDDLADTIDEQRKEQEEDREAFEHQKQQFEQHKQEFENAEQEWQRRDALKSQQISAMQAHLDAKLQEFQARLSTNEQTTEALRISEEKRVAAEKLAHTKQMELADSEAQAGQLVEAVAMCVPGILKAAGTIRAMENTASGQRALLNAGPHGVNLVEMLTNSQSLGILGPKPLMLTDAQPTATASTS